MSYVLDIIERLIKIDTPTRLGTPRDFKIYENPGHQELDTALKGSGEVRTLRIKGKQYVASAHDLTHEDMTRHLGHDYNDIEQAGFIRRHPTEKNVLVHWSTSGSKHTFTNHNYARMMKGKNVTHRYEDFE